MLQVSLAARQLINALLNRDPAYRLGSNTGANEIKQHPFFRGISWPLIRCMVLVFRLIKMEYTQRARDSNMKLHFLNKTNFILIVCRAHHH